MFIRLPEIPDGKKDFKMSEVKEILIERAKTHGNVDNVGLVYRLLHKALYVGRNGNDDYSSVQELVLDSIFIKLARISCGDPNFKDHWLDIAGYATLVVRELEAQNKEQDF